MLTFPDIPIARCRWGQTSNTQTFVSPLSRATQTRELPGAMWTADLSFNDLPLRYARQLAAFAVQLRGQAGRFLFSDPTLPENQGSLLGVPVVDQAQSNTATLIGSSGWTANETGVLLAGDMIGFVNDALSMVVADVDADASGNAVIQLEPPLRSQPTDGSEIVVSKPTCVMRLASDDQANWLTSPPLKSSFSLKLVEDIV